MPIKSTYPDLPLQHKDIFSFLFNRDDRSFPDDKVIYQDSDDLGRQYTYADVRTASIAFGKGLKSQHGFNKGDVLCVFSPNDIDVPPVVFGALWAGAVVSTANPGYTVDEFVFQLKDSNSKAVAAHYSTIDTVKKACKKVGIPDNKIFTLGVGQDSRSNLRHWKNVTQESKKGIDATKIDPDNDLAFLVYSSGTTGKPKGVELTHHNLTSNVQQSLGSDGGLMTWDGSKSCPGIPDAPKPQGDKVLATLPFFHIYGLNTLVIQPIYIGVHALVLAKFEIEKFCRLIQEERVTFSYIVPPMVLLLCKHPSVDKYDLSSLRMTNSGAAPLSKELVQGLFKRTGVRAKQGYGLSEVSPTIFQMSWQEWDHSLGSTGKMVPNLLAKICSIPDEGETAEELAQGETGELCVKGPNVFKRYHNNPEASAGCFDSEGYFKTGDIGHIDDQGNLYITDRAKELIKYKGFQVAPAELEGYLADHELVDDVAVVGVDSEELGTEVPRAYIVRKGGMNAVQSGDDTTIIQWLNGKVANHKKLRGGIKFVDTIPKSVSGKILRRILKEQAKKEYRELEGKMKAKL